MDFIPVAEAKSAAEIYYGEAWASIREIPQIAYLRFKPLPSFTETMIDGFEEICYQFVMFLKWFYGAVSSRLKGGG